MTCLGRSRAAPDAGRSEEFRQHTLALLVALLEALYVLQKLLEVLGSVASMGRARRPAENLLYEVAHLTDSLNRPKMGS